MTHERKVVIFSRVCQCIFKCLKLNRSRLRWLSIVFRTWFPTGWSIEFRPLQLASQIVGPRQLANQIVGPRQLANQIVGFQSTMFWSSSLVPYPVAIDIASSNYASGDFFTGHCCQQCWPRLNTGDVDASDWNKLNHLN